jgi:hypothetical protein
MAEWCLQELGVEYEEVSPSTFQPNSAAEGACNNSCVGISTTSAANQTLPPLCTGAGEHESRGAQDSRIPRWVAQPWPQSKSNKGHLIAEVYGEEALLDGRIEEAGSSCCAVCWLCWQASCLQKAGTCIVHASSLMQQHCFQQVCTLVLGPSACDPSTQTKMMLAYL